MQDELTQPVADETTDDSTVEAPEEDISVEETPAEESVEAPAEEISAE